MKKLVSTAIATTLAATGVGLGVSALSSPSTATAAPATSARAAGTPAFGLTTDDRLVSFRVNAPEQARVVGKVTGLRQDRRIVGIDVRPANGLLYGVGNRGGFYVINTDNARARFVDRLTVALQGRSFGVDWNPTVDALRIVSNTGQNLRHAPATGMTTADTVLNVPDTTDRLRGVTAAAYTNNDGSDRTGTALYDLNTSADSLVLQIPANAGTITTQGALRHKAFAEAGFDIESRLVNRVAAGNTGYATLGGARGYALYTVDLTSGKAARVGAFPRNLKVSDLSISL